jgi:hypothetical protein
VGFASHVDDYVAACRIGPEVGSASQPVLAAELVLFVRCVQLFDWCGLYLLLFGLCPSPTYTKGMMGFGEVPFLVFPIARRPQGVIRHNADQNLKLKTLQTLFSEGTEESKCVPDKGKHIVLILL